MLLLFVPEFAAQQFTGVVRDFLQPLFQGLAVFAVEAGIVWAQRRGGGLLIPSSLPGTSLLPAGEVAPVCVSPVPA